MASKLFNVTIEGVQPLLQHAFSDAATAALDASTRKVKMDQAPPREQAAAAAYGSDDAHWLPGAAIARILREAGSAHKQRGSRKSIKYLVPAAVLVTDDRIFLHVPGDPTVRVHTFEVDSRPVVIRATGGRIIRHRPRFDRWAATFTLRVNESILDAALVHRLLTDGGEQLGIGDYRPEKGGPFGVFRVTNWSSVE